MATLAGLESQWMAEEARFQQAKDSLVMLEEVRNNAAKTEAELASITSKMPSELELASLITELQNIANDAGVNLISIKPSATTPKDGFTELNVNISAVGSYVSLIDFIKRIENAQRQLKVDTIDIRVSQYPDLSLNLMLSAFTIDETGKAAPPLPVQSASANK
ncbi:MAG: type 4a pilus biogenesis protein PilO [Actinomycetota bacterium]